MQKTKVIFHKGEFVAWDQATTHFLTRSLHYSVKPLRMHSKTTVADAKLSAHHLNSMLAVMDLRGSHYHEALFCDYEGNISEGPGENFIYYKKRSAYDSIIGSNSSGNHS
jgi:branched-subunit amino acid aminotransferase/4-amino-4-deoxychorismate lyase